MFFKMDDKFNQFQIYCHACGDRGTAKWKKLSTSLNGKNLQSINGIRQVWTEMHSNLNGALVKTNRIPLRREYFYRNDSNDICRMYIRTLRIESTKCVLLFMASKFNFTPSFSQKRPSKSYFESNTILTEGNLKVKVQQEVWLSYGFSVNTYTMIVLQQDIAHSLMAYRVDGMLKPFPFILWLLLFSASYFSAAILAQKSCHSIKRYVSQVIKVWFDLCCLLLAQATGNTATTVVRRNDRKLMGTLIVVWFLWSLVALFITQLYQGEMFNSLANSYKPDVPSSLGDALNRGIAIGDYSSCISQEIGRRSSVSCAQETLRQRNETGALDLLETKLLNNLLWFSAQFTFEFIVTVINSGTAQVDLRRNFTLPNSFAVIYRKRRDGEIGILFELLSNFWVSSEIPVSSKSTSGCVFYSQYANFLSPMTQRALGQIEQSGLIPRWDKVVSDRSLMLNVYYGFKGITKNKLRGGKDISDYRGDYTALRRRFELCEDDCSANIERLRTLFEPLPSPIYFEVAKYYFTLLVMMPGFILLLEFIFRRCSRTKKAELHPEPEAEEEDKGEPEVEEIKGEPELMQISQRTPSPDIASIDSIEEFMKL